MSRSPPLGGGTVYLSSIEMCALSRTNTNTLSAVVIFGSCQKVLISLAVKAEKKLKAKDLSKH